MKIPDYKVGTTFETTCTLQSIQKGGIPFYNNFFISRTFAKSIFGKNPEDVIDVRCTITEEDVLINDLIKDPKYDNNTCEYFAHITFEDDGTYNISLIYGNIKLYFMCFPYTPDAERFYSHEFKDLNGNIIHKIGDRKSMSVRLKVERI
jgi:hypothetical protein